jgi:hypothetical protein
MTETVFLKYVVDAVAKSGMLTIEFEYSSSHLTINYVDVEFSDNDLRKHVECNLRVLRNIDSYLRNKLLYQEYNLNSRQYLFAVIYNSLVKICDSCLDFVFVSVRTSLMSSTIKTGFCKNLSTHLHS